MRKAEGETAALSRLGAAEVTTLTDADVVWIYNLWVRYSPGRTLRS